MNLRLSRREIAVGDVDGDALLALGRQPVDQQREVESLALRAVPPAVGLQRRELVVEDLPRLVQQPADQRRLAVVDAAAGDEAQQLLRCCAASQAFTSAGALKNSPPASSSPSTRCRRRGRSRGPAARSVALASISAMIVLDASRPRSRSRRTADSSRASGTAPARSRPARPARSRMRSSSTIRISAVALHRRPLRREIERHDLDPLAQDVLPDVELGPVGQREDAHALALVLARIVERPQLGPLALRVPAVVAVAEAEDPLLGAALLLVAPRAAERRVEAVLRRAPACSPSVFHMSVCSGAVVERVDALAPAPPGCGGRSARSPAPPRPGRAARTCRGTSRSCRRAAAGTAAAPGRTPSAPGAASPRCPCRSNRASPAAPPRRPFRAGCGCSRPRAGRDGCRSRWSSARGRFARARGQLVTCSRAAASRLALGRRTVGRQPAMNKPIARRCRAARCRARHSRRRAAAAPQAGHPRRCTSRISTPVRRDRHQPRRHRSPRPRSAPRSSASCSRRQAKAPAAGCRLAFKQLDTNKDGQLSLAEFPPPTPTHPNRRRPRAGAPAARHQPGRQDQRRGVSARRSSPSSTRSTPTTTASSRRPEIASRQPARNRRAGAGAGLRRLSKDDVSLGELLDPQS